MVISLPPLPPNLAPPGCLPVAETLPEAIQRIIQEIKPEKIILFGSYAYGNPTPDSDVDLLVIWETNLPRFERIAAISLLLSPRPFPVDIIALTPAEVEPARQNNFFIAEILARGQVIYERPQ